MKITINGVEQVSQRYNTVGDWYWHSSRTWDHAERGRPTHTWNPKDTLTIKVTQFEDWRYSALIAVHELVEALLCKWEGVSEASVDKFDQDTWPRIAEMPENQTSEPGEHHLAPYHTQHMFAEAIERLVALRLEVDWAEYTRAVEEVGK